MYDNPYEYDIENEDVVDDITFWAEAAKRYRAKRILELACGTGRLAIPLSKAGFSVTGLDINKGMLERCSLKLAKEGEDTQKNLTLHLCDMRDFDFNEAFDLIFIGFNSANHLLSIEDQLRVFKCVHKHLATGGRFMLDVHSPNLSLLAAAMDSQTELKLVTDFYVSDSGSRIQQYNSRKYSPEEQLWSMPKKSNSKASEKMRTTTDDVHVYFPRELHLLHMHSGFEVEDVYGDYSFGEFNSSSPRMIFVGRKV